MIELFTVIAGKVGISASLLLAVCTHESGLKNINNFTDRLEVGLGACQLHVSTARQFGKHYDMLALQQTRVNAKVAALYLKSLQKKYLYDSEVISSYNYGHVKYKNNRLVNHIYVAKVLNLRETIYGGLE
jgi:hypothetical protein